MISNQHKKSTSLVNKRITILLITVGLLIVSLVTVALFAPSRQSPPSEPVVSEVEPESLLVSYAHDEPFFAFAYPNDLTPSTFQDEDDGAEVILLEGKEPGRAVQIIARLFDEAGPLTVERVKRDLPEMVIENPQTALITDKKIPALLFWSDGDAAGKIREVWFTHEGYLYQVTARAEMDETLAKMMETWKFE